MREKLGRRGRSGRSYCWADGIPRDIAKEAGRQWEEEARPKRDEMDAWHGIIYLRDHCATGMLVN